MKYNQCVASLSLNGKIPARELKDAADAYKQRGMAPDAAMIKAVEDKIEMLRMEERGIVKAVREAYEAQGGKKRKPKAKEVEKPLDHGELNIPGRTGTINADLDRHKAQQAKEQKAKAKIAAHQTREEKARAKEVFAEIGDDMISSFKNLDPKAARKELDSMVKWEPKKFLALAEKFKKEQEEKGQPRMSVSADPADVIARLMADKGGEAVINIDGIGDVAIIYGDDKTGLAHIAKRRGEEFIDRLPDLLKNGRVYEKGNQKKRVFIGNDRDEAVISLDWNGEKKAWLLSAYERYPAKTGDASRRSEAQEDKMPDGEFFTKEDLRKSLTSNGVLGQVIASMIDAGIVVLHGGPSKLPRGAGKNIKGVQAVTMPDGTIHMVASNLTPRTALPVMLHEAFHQGGEKLIGSKEWGNLMGRMGSLYRQADKSTGRAREFYDRARVRVEAAREKGAVGRAMEVEEFAAYAIEEYEKSPDSLPAAIRKWVEDLIGLVKTWAVKRFGKQLGDVTPAQLAAMARWALMDVAVERRGEIFGPIAESFSVDDDADAPRFSVATPAPSPAPAGPARYTPPEQGRLRKLQAAIQDNKNRVKQVQEKIMEVAGVKSLGNADHYLAETNRPGRIAARLEDAQDKLIEPLMKKLGKSKYKPAQLSELLHAMHAKERNAAVAKINDEHADTENSPGSGMADSAADAIIDNYKNDAELHDMAKQARAIARATLDLKRAYGLITQEDYDTYSTMYKNYVPLKGDGEFGPKIKRAMGHSEREEFIMENIARDYNQAVIVGEKNLARQSLLQMVLQYPDDKLWTARVPPRGRYVAGKVYAVMDSTGKKVAAFTSQSQVAAFLEGAGPAAAGYRVVDSAGAQVVEFTKPLQDNEVMVYVNGDPVRLQIHDETLARQLRPLSTDQMGPILEAMRGVNQYLSKIYTGYNPAFILRNATRDAMTGTINMVGNQGAKTAAKAWKRYPSAIKTMAQWAKTKQIPNTEMGRYLSEYRQNGGKVGASYMSDLEDTGKSLDRMYDDAYGAKGYITEGRYGKASLIAGRKIIGGMAHYVEIANQAFENALRLALYATLREDGAPAAKAAQAAKTVTVDFDRKGTQTPTLGAIYLFFNPAIQGVANGMRTLAHGEHKAQAWAAMGALAAMGLYMASMGMDDDKDKWLGEDWDTRTKNWIMNVGDRQIRLPLSQEFAPAYAFGVAMGESMRGESSIRAAVNMVSSFIDAYFPLQGALKPDSDNHLADAAQALTPTVAKPFIESAMNRNTFGSQVVPESEFTKDRPDNLKMNKSTKGSAYDAVAQGVAEAGVWAGLAGRYENDITKVSPETIKSLWRTYTGGLGTFVADTAGLGAMGATAPGEVELTEVPFAKDFIKDASVKPLRGRYHALAREARAAISEFKLAKKAGDDEAMDKIMGDAQKDRMVNLGKMLQTTSEAAGAIGDEKVEINADQELSVAEKRAKLREIEEREKAMYREAIEAFRN